LVDAGEQAIATDYHRGLTEKIGDLAKRGAMAKEISREIVGRLDANEVRFVRDHLGIEPAGPAVAFGAQDFRCRSTG
jgi:hypothetical protein